MKRLKRILIGLACFSLLAALSCTTAGAGQVSGKIGDDFNWKFEPMSGTLTISGEGDMPASAAFYPVEKYWSDYQEEICHLVYGEGLTNVDRVESGLPTDVHGKDWQYTTAVYDLPHLETVTAKNDEGFSWQLDFTTSTLTIGPGEDKTELLSLTNLSTPPAHLVLADGVVIPPTLDRAGYRWASITLGKSVWTVDERWQSDVYIVDGGNPHLAAWKGDLYSRDLSVLYKSCGQTGTIQAPAALREISAFAFGDTASDDPVTVVIPEGVTTLASDALVNFGWNTTFVFPDSLTTIEDNCLRLPKESACTLIYSKQNTALKTVQTGEVARRVLDSVDGFYEQADHSNPLTDGFYTDLSVGGGSTYYYQDGKPVTGLRYIDGKAYIFDQGGVMLKSGWAQAEGNWYYLNDYGAGAVKCWRLGEDNQYRYLKENGKMACNEWIEDYHKWYYLDGKGCKTTGRFEINGKLYTFDENGVLVSGTP